MTHEGGGLPGHRAPSAAAGLRPAPPLAGLRAVLAFWRLAARCTGGCRIDAAAWARGLSGPLGHAGRAAEMS